MDIVTAHWCPNIMKEMNTMNYLILRRANQESILLGGEVRRKPSKQAQLRESPAHLLSEQERIAAWDRDLPEGRAA